MSSSDTGLRRALVLALLGALVLGLAACGGGGSSETGGGGDTVASAEPANHEALGRPHESSPRRGAGTGRRSQESVGSGDGGREDTSPQESLAAPEGSTARRGPNLSGGEGGRSGAGPSAGGRGSVYGGPTRATAKAAEKRARRKARAVHRHLAREAGAAAPFLVETGDNSIPTYGSEASAGEASGAEAALAGYLEARAAGEWARACAQLSAQLQQQIASPAGEEGGGGDCVQAYAKLAERLPTSARANPLAGRLTALRVEGPHAFALFYGPGEQQYMMPLAEEGGVWKVMELEPVPWPIGSTAR